MANANLKKDFQDGDKLFAQQLNNNFAAIEAALAAMNKIVWQGDEDADAVVTFRGTGEEIAARDVINGQLLYNTETGETYIDYNDERISTGSGNAIHIGEDAPTNTSTQLWIDPTDSMVGIIPDMPVLEGSWTPALGAINASTEEESITATYISRSGRYIKMGKMVYVEFYIKANITAFGGTNKYGILKGLPFTVSSSNFGMSTLNLGVIYDLIESQDNMITIVPYNNSTYARIQDGNGTHAAVLKTTTGSYAELAGSGWYIIRT